MMLFLAQQSRMKSVILKLLVILLSLSAQSGPERFAVLLRDKSQNILLTLDVLRYLERSVPLLAVDSHQQKSPCVMTRPRPLSRMLPRKHVALSPREHVAMLPNLSPSLSPKMSVLMYPRRCAPGQESTQNHAKGLLSRNGAMSLLKSQDLPKLKYYLPIPLHCHIQYITV